MKKLNDYELANVVGGEPITLTAMMAILIVAIISVIAYRIFVSSKGNATLPGGFKFTWD